MAGWFDSIDDLHHEMFEATRTGRVVALNQWAVRDPRRELADAIEESVRARLVERGYFVQAQRHKQHFDLLANGVRIEVKAARWDGQRYQFNMHSNDADVVVLACVDQVAEIGWSSVVHFVVPFDEVKVRGIDITQRDPMLYRGRLAGWIERWDVIDDLIEMGCNHWQMALPII